MAREMFVEERFGAGFSLAGAGLSLCRGSGLWYTLLMVKVGWPIAVRSTEDAAAGTRLWRQRGQRYVTVAVKVTTEIVPGGTVRLVQPLPIERDERLNERGQGLATGGDLAPYLAKTEILVLGYAYGPRVHVALARDATLLFRKTVDVPASSGPFLPARVAALAPLSRSWPVRARFAPSIAATSLEAPELELPEVFDFSFFQCALPDQHLPPLRGDEWLRVEGMHPTERRIDTRLPGVRARAILFARGSREARPVPMGLDTVFVDVERGRVCLVFRGYLPLLAGVLDRDQCVVSGIEWPGRTLVLKDPFGAEENKEEEAPALYKESAPSLGASTFMLDDAMLALLAGQKALPFAGGAPSPVREPMKTGGGGLPFQASRVALPTLPREPAGLVFVKPGQTEERDEGLAPGEVFLSVMAGLGKNVG